MRGDVVRIRLGRLKRLIGEVALSPSVFRNAERTDDPMDDRNIAGALERLEQPFKSALEKNMVLDAQASYDEETREFDDAEYERIKDVAARAAEAMLAGAHKAVQRTWADAMVQGQKKSHVRRAA
jgi:hypothetical protein